MHNRFFKFLASEASHYGKKFAQLFHKTKYAFTTSSHSFNFLAFPKVSGFTGIMIFAALGPTYLCKKHDHTGQQPIVLIIKMAP